MQRAFMLLGLVVLIIGAVFIPLSQNAQINHEASYPFITEIDLPLGYQMSASSFSFYTDLESGKLYHLDLVPPPGGAYSTNMVALATVTLTITDPQSNTIYSDYSGILENGQTAGHYVEGIDSTGDTLFDFGPFYTSGNCHFVLEAVGFTWIGGNGPLQAKLYEIVATQNTSYPYALLLYVGIALVVVGSAIMAFAFLHVSSSHSSRNHTLPLQDRP
jgi:hypothetical protein